MTTETLALNDVYNMDCVSGMKLLSDNSIDLIVTDPPFAIDFKAKRGNYNRSESRVLEGYREIKTENYGEFTRNWIQECHRILKDSGSMYIFSGWNNLKDILIALDELGFITVNHIIWKYQFGVVTKRKFVTSHYHCIYVCKDDALRKFFPFSRYAQNSKDPLGGSLHYQDKEDVWFIKREYWHGDKKTPTKLPSDVIKKILQYSSEEGDVVFDPFIGSGQVAVVSKTMKRKYIGFEIVEDYYRFAKTRLDSDTYRLKHEDNEEQISNSLDIWA
ncbi:MAG: site-specific DNA-methyltransferase [Thaumarchaeota archaeon]|nr:site-specific DNA-methyltransferase [Nitrososphaerota archaeon]